MKTLHLLIIAIGILVGITLVPAFADEPEWHVQRVTGKFLNSNPPKPDQIFNFQYRVLNGTLVELIKNQYGQFEAKVQSTDESMLELKIPRNYPYSNMGYPYYNNTGNVAGTNAGIEVNGVFLNPQKYSLVSTDCFFEYSVPFIGKSVITLDFIVYPEGIPYAGDKVPDNCISETTFIDSPLKEFKSGIAANDIKCEQDLQLVIKAEDGSPACVKSQTAQKLVEHGWGWALQAIDSIKPLRPNRIIGLENDTGIVTFGNQTYYFETPNYTETAYFTHVQVSFHDVVFTLFPSGFRGGLPDNAACGGKYYWTDAKFSDGTSELLHIFPITSMSQQCLALPEPTHFSTHTNPQAGLTFYDGKMKLLVSMEEATDDTAYLSQTVDEWKNKTPAQLDAYYKKYKDTFYTELGSFLIKNEMKKELERQKIQNIHDDFKVFPGMTLDSLPPHISYDAVVNATDGNSYLLLGGVFANKIESLKITKLVFDKEVLNSLSTGKKPSYTNQFEKAPKVVISEQSGTNPVVEPYSLTLDLDKNHLVTFYNNLTVPIRIQPYGSGLTVDEDGLSWKSKVIGPDKVAAIQFNKTGYYEWNARSPPQGSENGWDFHGTGRIAAFSQYHDNSTSREKPKMAQVFVTDSDIPWSSTGLDKYGDLEIGLYESIYHMIPDAQKYYAARAMQLIPFDVPVIITSPSFTEK